MINKDPLVSIIINCYNGEKYLREAIDSVYSQTYTNWEIIFWDNASTDSSSIIARSYDAKIKYFRSQKNYSLGYSRSQAVKKINGDLFSFLDCDDLWLKDKLEKQIKIFKNDTSLAFIYGLTEIIYNDNKNNQIKKKIIPETNKLFEGDIFDKLILEDFIPFPSVLINKSKFNGYIKFPKDFNHSVDYWIFLHLAYKYKVGVLKEVCCKYRIHEKNLSKSQLVRCALENIFLVKTFLPDQRAKKSLKYHYVTLAIAYLKEKKLIDAFLTILKYGGWNKFINRIIKKAFYKLIYFWK